MNSTKYYFLDRAALMRNAAEQAETPQLHTARLRAAAGYDVLAEKAEQENSIPLGANSQQSSLWR